MSAGPYLTNEQLDKLKRYFEEYKANPKLTLRELAERLNLHKTTVPKRFKQMFGEEYTKIAKRRSIQNLKLEDKQIKSIFKRYRAGEFLRDLADEYNINRKALACRLRKVIGLEYTRLAKTRRHKDGGINRRKVTSKEIERAFDRYKQNRVPLIKIAEELGIKENSLIDRFNKKFGKEYKKIAKSRRDERKVTNEQYMIAFDRYCNTNVALVQLSTELNIQLSSLASKFRKLFGQKYRDVASKKMDLIEANRKGRIAEQIARKYLKGLGINFEDVHRRYSLEGSLKKPIS